LDPHKLGFSTASLPGHSIAEAAAVGRDLGFRTIELLAFDGFRHSQGQLAGFWFDGLCDAERERLRDVLAPFAHRATHAPFVDAPLFTHNLGIRAETLRQQQVTIEATAWLGGSTTTLHVNQKIGYALDEYRGEIVETFRALGDRAADHGITLTIETGFPPGVETFAALIHEIGHPAVGANLDVGHLVGYEPRERWREPDGPALYNDTLLRQVQALGDKLLHLHLHDVRAQDMRDHCEVGAGVVDYRRLMRCLADHGFTGLMTFELEAPDLVGALTRSKALVETALAEAGNPRRSLSE
jgi:sugar phosphate isomerase/epimerase